MPSEDDKVKINISLDRDVADQLRRESFARYGNSRSISKMIEDLSKKEMGKMLSVEEIKGQRNSFVESCAKQYEQEFFAGVERPELELLNVRSTYQCPRCQTEFETGVTDAHFCPACQSTELKNFGRIPDPNNLEYVRNWDKICGLEAKEKIYREIVNYIISAIQEHAEVPVSDIITHFNTSYSIIYRVFKDLNLTPAARGKLKYFSDGHMEILLKRQKRPSGYAYFEKGPDEEREYINYGAERIRKIADYEKENQTL